MAKTKEQKHNEAISRARKSLSIARNAYLQSQLGGSMFDHYVRRYGPKQAEWYAQDAYRKYLRQCQDAHCDIHGHPLKEPH